MYKALIIIATVIILPSCSRNHDIKISQQNIEKPSIEFYTEIFEKPKIIIDDKCNSRLQKYTSIIGGVALVSSIVGGFILIAVALLKSIDAFLEKCDPNNKLEPISKEIQDIADAQAQAQQTQNETTYKGFIIEIELVPYTSTIIRRRAIGKNQNGIILIQTELSFTTDDQTLIDELKLIIDRDNLKAY